MVSLANANSYKQLFPTICPNLCESLLECSKCSTWHGVITNISRWKICSFENERFLEEIKCTFPKSKRRLKKNNCPYPDRESFSFSMVHNMKYILTPGCRKLVYVPSRKETPAWSDTVNHSYVLFKSKICFMSLFFGSVVVCELEN